MSDRKRARELDNEIWRLQHQSPKKRSPTYLPEAHDLLSAWEKFSGHGRLQPNNDAVHAFVGSNEFKSFLEKHPTCTDKLRDDKKAVGNVITRLKYWIGKGKK